ncbi:MAG: hypothetical protein Q7R87_02975 [Nanoarchaeota archaeon]|nr:hypothetical protein [Nanoarchaeota archaeon]
MSFVKPAKEVKFISNEIEDNFNALSDDWLKKAILRAIKNLKDNAFCGERIKKKLIPKKYLFDYDLDNLWWYPLPNGWRLVYTLTPFPDRNIVASIIEYFNHKDYERRFGYT